MKTQYPKPKSGSPFVGSALQILGILFVSFTLLVGFASINSPIGQPISPLLFWGGIVSGLLLIGISSIIKFLSQLLATLKKISDKLPKK